MSTYYERSDRPMSLMSPLFLALASLLITCQPQPLFAQQKPPTTSSPAMGGKSGGVPAPPPMTPEIKKCIIQYQMAERLLKQGKGTEAISAYKEFVRLADAAKMGDDAVLPAYDSLYHLYQQQNNLPGMETTLQHIAKIMPKNPGVWVEYATLYLNEKRFTEAKTYADRALTLNPPPLLAAQAHFVRGVEAYARKQWTVAETEYTIAVKLAPENVQSRFNLLLTYNMERKNKQAISTAESLLKVDPKMIPARLIMAALKQENKDLTGALAAFDKVLIYAPRNTDALFNRAILLQQTQRVDEAASAYNDYLTVVPKDFNGQFNLGLIYINVKNFVAAQKHFAIAVQVRPKETRAVFNLALCEREIGFATASPEQRVAMLNKSILHFKQAIAQSPKDEKIQNQLAGLYQHAGDFPAALAIFQKQSEADPDNPEPIRSMSMVLTAQRKLDIAIVEWRKYRTRKPGDPISYDQIADLLEAQQKWKEASEERLLQIQRDPNNGAAKLDIAHEYRELKQPENAEIQYKLVLDLDARGKDVSDKERPYIMAARLNWHVKAWRGLSELADAKGDLDGAIAYLQNIKLNELNQSGLNQKAPDAQVYLDIANLYERQKRNDLALKEYTLLTVTRPEDPKVYAALGDFAERQGHIEEAVAAYNRAEERANDPSEYGLKSVSVYQKHQMLEKAITELSRLVSKYPKEARLSTRLAEALEQSHDDNRALALYDALLKLKPADYTLMEKKAVVLTRLKRYPEAIVLREKMVDGNPGEYQVYANLLNVYTLAGKLDAYLPWLKARVEKDPGNLTSMAAMIDAFHQQNIAEEGWMFARKVVLKHKDDIDVQECYVGVLMQHKKLKEGIEIRRQEVLQNPKSLEIMTRLSELLVQDGQADEAQKAQEAFIARPDVPSAMRIDARRLLTKHLISVGKAQQAIDQYKLIIQAEPQDLSSILALGGLLVSTGQESEALAMYTQRAALETNVLLLRAHFLTLIGDIYTRQSRKVEAEVAYKKALKLNPESQEAANALKRLTNTK